MSRREAYCATCGAARPEALGQRATKSRPPSRRWWIPAGIAAGGVAAILGGAFLAIVLLGDDDDPELVVATPSSSVDASPTPEPDATASTPEPTSTPAASVAPTPVPAEVIANRAIARVTAPELNLRASAGRSSDVLAVLKGGQLLFIIGSPTEVDDLRWYRVAIVNDPTECAESCGLIGFVSTPMAEEDRWIEEAELTCPTSPMTAEALGRLQPLEALSCFGRNEIVVTATVDHPFHGPMTPYRLTPDWMRTGFSVYMRHASWVWFVTPPGSGLASPEPQSIVRATGHLEHPDAVNCRTSVDPDFFGGSIPDDFVPIDRARVVLNCRSTFVWTAYDVIGTERIPEPSAEPMGNDRPDAAASLEIGAEVRADTRGNASEPEQPCLHDGGYVVPVGRTAWWRVTGTGGTVVVDTAGSDFDTVVGVYVAVDGQYQIIACIDDVDGRLQARADFLSQAGATYYVQVGGFGGQGGQLVVRAY